MKLQEWQAILAAYGILLIGAQTSLAPLAVLTAWGVAVTYFLGVATNQGDLISNLFSAPTAPAPSTNLATNTTGAPGGTQGLNQIPEPPGVQLPGGFTPQGV